MIKTYSNYIDLSNDLENLMALAYLKGEFFKAEIFKTEDNRWRLGIQTKQQMEFDFDG